MKAAIVCAALALVACKKDEPASGRPKPIASAERQRGETACKAYVDRLCACTAQKPALAERCDLKKAKLDALRMALAVDDDPSVEAGDVFLAQDAAREVIAKCIEENAQLDSECP